MNASVDTAGAMAPQDVINLARYPIGDPDNPERAALVKSLRDYLDTHQYVALPDFILPEARLRAVAEIDAVSHEANHNSSFRNCYLSRVKNPSLPEDHPINIFEDTSNWILAYDQLPDTSPLKTLYHWDAVRDFVAEIVGEDRLYDNEDPYQPVNVLIYNDGDRSSWHFDSVNAFTVTLMLQAPEEGGDFELVPNLREDELDNPDGIRAVLEGKGQPPVPVAREPGALCIFRGCTALHRVAPVKGATQRLMAVMVYEDQPGVVGRPDVNETIFGPRVAANG